MVTAKNNKYKITGEHFYKFFQCPHWIWYDVYADPKHRKDIPPIVEMIHRGGLHHEKEKEILSSRKFEEIKPELLQDLDEAFFETLRLMKEGSNIYHGVLLDGNWAGMPDLLKARPMAKELGGPGGKSNFGDHYYVVYDVKLGPEIRTEYKFQLVFYSLILERLQGVRPQDAFIINSDGEEMSFMVDDFIDQFKLSLNSIEKIMAGEKPPPFLKSGCKHSPWYTLCENEAKECDDVSLIYRISQSDQRHLYDLGIKTIKDLANADINHMQSNLQYWNFDKILRFNSQANSLLKNEIYILKKPNFPEVKNEIHFDIESDPTSGIDYLFGILIKSGGKTEYKYFWAESEKDQEKCGMTF